MKKMLNNKNNKKRRKKKIQKLISVKDLKDFQKEIDKAATEGLEPIGDIVSRSMVNSEYVAIVSNIALVSYD